MYDSIIVAECGTPTQGAALAYSLVSSYSKFGKELWRSENQKRSETFFRLTKMSGFLTGRIGNADKHMQSTKRYLYLQDMCTYTVESTVHVQMSSRDSVDQTAYMQMSCREK